MNLANSYGKCLERLAKFRNHVVFSARCKQSNLIPPSLKVKPPINTERGKTIANRASRQFLDERLRVANYKVRHLEDELKWTELGIRRQLNTDDVTKLEEISKGQAEKTFLRIRERQQDKFERFVQREKAGSNKEHIDTQHSVDQTRWVINKSSRTLSEDELKVLQRGLNFAQHPTALPKSEIISGVESALRNHEDSQIAERARSTIASIIRRHRPQIQNITPKERQAIRDLKKDDEVVILPVDKGNATVLLDTKDYLYKANDLLDKPPFRQVARNPTSKNEKRVNCTLKNLVEKKKINTETYHALRVSTNGTKPPLFYGSVKIHKQDFPLRPIVSATGSATYNVSKYVSRVLTPYVRETPSYIANTADLLEKLNKEHIDEDEIMLSFDVKSLFTNVPRKDAFNTIRQIVEDDTHFKTKNRIEPGTLLELLKLCLSTTSFQFRRKHYELADGLPMGSPASPVVANLFMAKLEEKALTSFKERPKLWYRYVDDIISIVKAKVVEELLAHLNDQHPSISFTVEREENGQLPFMDAHIHRVAGSLKMGVYRKPTHTGRYLQFSSNHPENAKKSVVNALFKRLDYITLGDAEKESEKQRIYAELAANGYPTKFIQKTVTGKSSRRKRDTTKEGTKPIAVATIPYVKGLSEQIVRVLGRLNVRTVLKPSRLKWTIMTGAKDKIEPKEEPGVVYAVGCAECEKVYIGETNRTAKQRIREHRSHTRTGHTELSGIAEHAHNMGHSIYWEPRILAKESNHTKRKVREAMAIHKLGREKTMNLDCGLELSKLWLDIVKP